MTAYCVVMFGSITVAFGLLTLQENFLWHLSGLVAIVGGATVLTVIHARSGVWQRLSKSTWDGFVRFWLRLSVPTAILILAFMVWSWGYIYTTWPGHFMIQIVGILGTALVGCFSATWAICGPRPRTEPPPNPSSLPMSKERVEMLIKM